MAPGLANMNAQMLDAKMALFDAPLQALDMQNQFDAMQDKIASGDTSKSTIIQFLKT
jgi:ABC-type cobalamin/Fe3+-siderophores transport system ATPase subunit